MGTVNRISLAFLFLSISACFAGKTIEITKSEHKIRFYDAGKLIKEYSCALGKGGNGRKQRVGDNLTPEGEYRIVSVNRTSGFHIFLHLSYPNKSDVENGHAKGIIGDSTYLEMLNDISNGRLPKQNSKLGGNVGIHGIKNGLGWLGGLQSSIDWTQGCISVTNQEIEEIASVIEAGTKVRIRK